MSPRAPRNVPPLARHLDMCGLVLLLIGAGCYGRAYLGMMQLREHGVAPGSGRFAGIAQFDRLWELSRIGLGIGAIAIVVMIAAAVVTWRARRTVPVSGPISLEDPTTVSRVET